MSGSRRNAVVALLAACAVAVACGEDNPFRDINASVIDGTDQVWEVDAGDFPSVWSFSQGRRFFLGSGELGSFDGTWVLDARADGTLVFRPFSTVVPALSAVRTGIRDLGPTAFESVQEVPDGGYSDVNDSTGVAVVQDHVYAFRVSQIGASVIPINYAKLQVLEVDRQDPDDPLSRFVRFRWAYQAQPLNRRVVVEGSVP